MTLEQLRIFVAVAEREHVTRAARDLSLTQSATSAAVAALEARYQTRLFDRVGRRIVLTEAGRIFLEEARAVLARAASAETALADLAGLKRGSLSLAASQTVGNYWLPPLMQRYRARFPDIALEVRIGNTETVAGWVREGVADLGFVEGEVDGPELEARPVAEDELVLVVGAGHPWARATPAGPLDFAATDWVIRERGSGTRAALEAAAAAAGLAPEALPVAFEFPSNEAVRAAVEAGGGASVMSRLVAGAALKAGTLVALDLALPSRRFSLLRHRRRSVTAAEREFCALAPGGDAAA
ncbi:transcriptional regulator, LysR family [Tistlia consotensis]|uniref:Transcriptional regulator, LysR family n=1 Tax=Tistlia consotensis USBA 355 TaxID=560819 RepID=A0A1Y6BA82_9PROT|nr:LysR family transcriptional regulator [Tistlia consotensis]SME93811.1 transcriptional regulator, LysR family [Tistlia consotensis USBA 355]SNR28819.1 transcriptional regulator, LysR family [Tistlia consotensis]